MCGFSLPVRNFGGLTVAVLPAEVDCTNSDAVRDTLLALLNREHSGLVADMSGTSFCDASGVRAVVRAHHHAQVLGSRLSAVITHPAVRRVFTITGADAILRISPTVGQALSLHDMGADSSPGRQPPDDAPRVPGPQAPRTATDSASETTAAQHGNVTAAKGGTLNTGLQDGHASPAARPADGPGSPGQSPPEQETHALSARLHEAISRSRELRSQSVRVFARLAVTYAELADLAEQQALESALGVEHLKAVSVTARDRSLDCRQLATEKPRL